MSDECTAAVEDYRILVQVLELEVGDHHARLVQVEADRDHARAMADTLMYQMVGLALTLFPRDHPDVVSDHPDVVSDHPDVVSDHPDVVSDQPPTGVDQPGMVDDQPGMEIGRSSLVDAYISSIWDMGAARDGWLPGKSVAQEGSCGDA